ncbi:hypothetical protein BAY61_27460 [Prauserella marina]|uniref:Uncharacterized protein n=1 Tax=Prauserella marina TaxID=530584 RepID=A0A222VW41_9PSEU|nr:hypothetical protein [Prauserella marina]ASR38127.1 hypothetical protein BAY61_27460 [Prauserella marina]PWV78711.1 hypothetical protein DES30_104448 [Prauserella marina]SDC92002.1 hypothetical protein SAMN05421630_104447 [Prauserella marina]
MAASRIGAKEARELALPTKEPYPTLWPSISILVAVLLLVTGLHIVDSAIPGEQPIPAGTTIHAGPSVSFVPANGWALDKGDGGPGSLITTSSVIKEDNRVAVSAAEWQGTLEQQVERNKRQIAVSVKHSWQSEEQTFTTGSGLVGSTFSFRSAKKDGQLWIAVDDRRELAVVVTASGGPESFQAARGQIEGMVGSVRIGVRS